ncbi:hypothetical protein NL676_007398 [Syzygium grande]|nr:hypothetical protein NL676_007398 [Syzygium grande]
MASRAPEAAGAREAGGSSPPRARRSSREIRGGGGGARGPRSLPGGGGRGFDEEALAESPRGPAARRLPRGHAGDVHILSCGFLLIFSAYGAAQNLESTVNTVTFSSQFRWNFGRIIWARQATQVKKKGRHATQQRDIKSSVENISALEDDQSHRVGKSLLHSVKWERIILDEVSEWEYLAVI